MQEWLDTAARLKKKLDKEQQIVAKELKKLHRWSYDANKSFEVLGFLYRLGVRQEQLYTRYQQGTKIFLSKDSSLDHLLKKLQKDSYSFFEAVHKRQRVLRTISPFPKIQLEEVEKGFLFKKIDESQLHAQTQFDTKVIKKVHKNVLRLLEEENSLKNTIQKIIDELARRIIYIQEKVSENQRIKHNVIIGSDTISSIITLSVLIIGMDISANPNISSLARTFFNK